MVWNAKLSSKRNTQSKTISDLFQQLNAGTARLSSLISRLASMGANTTDEASKIEEEPAAPNGTSEMEEEAAPAAKDEDLPPLEEVAGAANGASKMEEVEGESDADTSMSEALPAPKLGKRLQYNLESACLL